MTPSQGLPCCLPRDSHRCQTGSCLEPPSGACCNAVASETWSPNWSPLSQVRPWNPTGGNPDAGCCTPHPAGHMTVTAGTRLPAVTVMCDLSAVLCQPGPTRRPSGRPPLGTCLRRPAPCRAQLIVVVAGHGECLSSDSCSVLVSALASSFNQSNQPSRTLLASWINCSGQ